jgi:DNA-binding GntR family transcriptional regulator
MIEVEKNSATKMHELAYQAIKDEILFGGLLPGKQVTLRGLAERLNVSPTPIRETVKRLIAERALELHPNRRISIPAIDKTKFQDIHFARLSLEPELAIKAIPFINKKTIASLKKIDSAMDDAIATGDVVSYMRSNHAFHFTIYKTAKSAVLSGLVESLWLQFAPYLSTSFGKFGTSIMLDDDHHKKAISGLERRHAEDVRAAIHEDIQQGMSAFDNF